MEKTLMLGKTEGGRGWLGGGTALMDRSLRRLRETVKGREAWGAAARCMGCQRAATWRRLGSFSQTRTLSHHVTSSHAPRKHHHSETCTGMLTAASLVSAHTCKPPSRPPVGERVTELRHTEQRRISRAKGYELSGRSETQGTLRCTGPVSGARERSTAAWPQRRDLPEEAEPGASAEVSGAGYGGRGEGAHREGRAGRGEGAHSEGVPDGSRLVCSCDERRAPGRVGTAGPEPSPHLPSCWEGKPARQEHRGDCSRRVHTEASRWR